jgi:hypothetical protein
MTKTEQLQAMVDEMYEAGVISDELAALYREKERAFEDAIARHQALMADYAQLRPAGAVDDVDRRFAEELIADVVRAARELDGVSRNIHTAVMQAAYRASLVGGTRLEPPTTETPTLADLGLTKKENGAANG